MQREHQALAAGGENSVLTADAMMSIMEKIDTYVLRRYKEERAHCNGEAPGYFYIRLGGQKLSCYEQDCSEGEVIDIEDHVKDQNESASEVRVSTRATEDGLNTEVDSKKCGGGKVAVATQSEDHGTEGEGAFKLAHSKQRKTLRRKARKLEKGVQKRLCLLFESVVTEIMRRHTLCFKGSLAPLSDFIEVYKSQGSVAYLKWYEEVKAEMDAVDRSVGLGDIEQWEMFFRRWKLPRMANYFCALRSLCADDGHPHSSVCRSELQTQLLSLHANITDEKNSVLFKEIRIEDYMELTGSFQILKKEPTLRR